MLAPYIHLGLVELIEWPSTDAHAISGVDDYLHCPYQIGAYRDCLKNRAIDKAEWVAIIDVDEYVVPAKSAKAFHAVLETSKKDNVGSLKIHWKTFGTSRVSHLKPGEWLVEKLIRRAPDNYWVDLTHVKSIHQPKAAANHCRIHDASQVEEPYHIKTLPLDVCRIHHYWSGTEERCDEKRTFKTPEDKKNHLNELNAVVDFSIYPYLDHLSPVD